MGPHSNGTAPEKERLQALLGKPRQSRSQPDVNWVYGLMQDRGSIEYARQAAREFLTAADAAATPNPMNTGSS